VQLLSISYLSFKNSNRAAAVAKQQNENQPESFQEKNALLNTKRPIAALTQGGTKKCTLYHRRVFCCCLCGLDFHKKRRTLIIYFSIASDSTVFSFVAQARNNNEQHQEH